MSIKLNILKILPLLLILLFGFGCSDFMDKYGDMLPGFLKTEKKKEEPKTHKIKDKTPVKSTETEGEVTTPTEEGKEVPPAEKEPAEKTPEGDKTPKEKVTTPKEEDKTKTDLKETKKEEPAKDEGTKPKEGETATEDKKPETKDVTEKPPVKKETTTDKPTKITSKDIGGEDVALVSISAKEGPPETGPSDKGVKDEDYFYDPRQKRDPFRPYNLKVEKKKEVIPEELTPLQKYKLSQLNLKAIIYDSESDTGVAMVEDPTKKGFNIYVGTEIGEGRVVRITPDEVQVEMQYEDFYGNVEKRIETLKLSGVK